MHQGKAGKQLALSDDMSKSKQKKTDNLAARYRNESNKI
ncbi:MAG: hypothetical protein ACJAXM_000758 [Arenicella sp.]|jgi:hypothetical protein